MSSAARARATTSCPRAWQARTTSRPSIPAAPVTRTFTAPSPCWIDEPAESPSSRDLDLRVVADDHAQRLREAIAARELDVAAEKTRLHARIEPADAGAREQDRVLHLGTLDDDVLVDGGVGADVGVRHPSPRADDRRAPYHGPLQAGARLHHDAA